MCSAEVGGAAEATKEGDDEEEEVNFDMKKKKKKRSKVPAGEEVEDKPQVRQEHQTHTQTL